MRCRECATPILDAQLPCPACGRSAEPVCTIGLTGGVPLLLTAYGIAMMVASLVILAFLGPTIPDTVEVGWSWVVALGVGTAVFIGSIAAHELIHGAAMRMYGARARYGVGFARWWIPYAYATAPGRPFELAPLVVICLAPFVVLSTASIAVMLSAPGLWGYAAVVFFANFSGSVGDLWFVAKMIRFRRCADLWMVDIVDRLAIYTPDPAAAAIARQIETPRAPTVLLAHLIVWWTVVSFTLLMSFLPVSIVLDLWGVKRADIGLAQYPLFSIEPTGLAVYPLSIVALGLVLAVPLTLLVRRLHARPDPGARTPRGAPRPAFL